MIPTLKIQPICEYDHYGHSPGSTLWLWNEPKLEEVPAGPSVFHYKIWGYHFTEILYRGRHDALRKIISVFPPEEKIGTHSDLPETLQIRLEKRFPESDILLFDL